MCQGHLPHCCEKERIRVLACLILKSLFIGTLEQILLTLKHIIKQMQQSKA
jgi:hypothetical protein